VYPENWACSQREDPPDFTDIDDTVGEWLW